MPNTTRKPKITEEKINIFLKCLEEGKTITDSAKAIGFGYATVTGWLRRFPQYAEKFREVSSRKEKEENEKIVMLLKKVAVKRAKGYKTQEITEVFDGQGTLVNRTVKTREVPGDSKLIQFLLCNLAPDKWKINPNDDVKESERDNTIKLVID